MAEEKQCIGVDLLKKFCEAEIDRYSKLLKTISTNDITEIPGNVESRVAILSGIEGCPNDYGIEVDCKKYRRLNTEELTEERQKDICRNCWYQTLINAATPIGETFYTLKHHNKRKPIDLEDQKKLRQLWEVDKEYYLEIKAKHIMNMGFIFCAMNRPETLNGIDNLGWIAEEMIFSKDSMGSKEREELKRKLIELIDII